MTMLHVWATSPAKRETLAPPLGGAVTGSSGASRERLPSALLAAALGPKRPSIGLSRGAKVAFFGSAAERREEKREGGGRKSCVRGLAE